MIIRYNNHIGKLIVKTLKDEGEFNEKELADILNHSLISELKEIMEKKEITLIIIPEEYCFQSENGFENLRRKFAEMILIDENQKAYMFSNFNTINFFGEPEKTCAPNERFANIIKVLISIDQSACLCKKSDEKE